MSQNRYLEAARADIDKLQSEFEEVRQNVQNNGASGVSQTLETAWNDLQEHWQKLQAAGDTAPSEVQSGFQDARERFQRILNSYRNG
ncbi:hypothetical protein [Rhodovibrio salinarum]|uniref:Uncharacterized protein n=1 Tax=Rhodovibrio salinarum TaxID=1087 RepID=A0A934UYK9_9PROT|nr:hypothetical protein [Rhodovibrio salinarum]MBK1696207.1 hypothetical protein [Rhodovibrio salinarum]